MIAFKSPNNPSRANMTYVPGPEVQNMFAQLPPETVAIVKEGLEPTLSAFAASLDAALLSGPLSAQAIDDLDHAIHEVAQRIRIRLRQ